MLRIDPDQAMNFLEFVSERHKVWEARQAGAPQPWTLHNELATRKFTNVFRILDHGSQYLLDVLVDPELSERDQLMRLFLYRHTGRVEVWEFLDTMIGLPVVGNLDEILTGLQEYRGVPKVVTKRPWTQWKNPDYTGPELERNQYPNSVFTGAYLVFPQSADPGTDKLESIIDLTRRLFHPDSPEDVMPDFLAAKNQAARFHCLRRNKGVADFMSMQVLTDWGYTPHCGEDREAEFVVPGPGARKGAAALSTAKAELVLPWAVEAVRDMADCPALPRTDNTAGSYVRKPSLMDVQNCLCEFSKLVRFQSKLTEAKPYKPAHPGPQPSPTIPAHF